MTWGQFILIIGVLTLCYYLFVGGYIMLKNGKLFAVSPKNKSTIATPKLEPVNAVFSTKKTINQQDFVFNDNSFNNQNKSDFNAASLNYQNGIIDLSGSTENNSYNAELPTLEDTFNESEKMPHTNNEIIDTTVLDTQHNHFNNNNLLQHNGTAELSQQLSNFNNADAKNEKETRIDVITENNVNTILPENANSIINNDVNKVPKETTTNYITEPTAAKPIKMDSLLHLINKNLNNNENNA